MVVAAKKSRELELSLESFFLGKWVMEDTFPCIPSVHLHMPRLRSHSKREVNKKPETEIPLVSDGKPPSAVEKNVKRRDIVFFISTPDIQMKSKCRIDRETSKSKKVRGNSKTVNPSLVMETLPSEPLIHCVKKTDVVHEDASPDGQMMNKGRGIKRKINRAWITESQLQTTKAGSLSCKGQLGSLVDQNKENSDNEHSLRRSERKAAKKARACFKEISNSMIYHTLVEEKVSETKPNKDGQQGTGKKVKNKPEEERKYRQRYSEESEIAQESGVKLGKNENELNMEEQGKTQGSKAKTRKGRRDLEKDSYSDDSCDESWMDHKEKKKKIAKKKLEKSNRKRSLTKDENKTKRASTKRNPSSEQKKTESQNITQGPDKDVNSRKMEDEPKKVSTVKSKKMKTTYDVAAKACSQENQNENLNPEDCLITAKKGTLRYLKQRERFLEVKAKEAQVEEDFFSNDKALKKKAYLDLLLVPASLDDSFTIKTPQSKKAQVSDSVITPRTAFLGKFGSVTPSSQAVTPSTSSPVSQSKAEDRNAALEVMYHQMKGTSRRPRGIRKNRQNNFGLSDSILKKKKMQVSQLLELPDFVNSSSEGDTSHDEYFNNSDTI